MGLLVGARPGRRDQNRRRRARRSRPTEKTHNPQAIMRIAATHGATSPATLKYYVFGVRPARRYSTKACCASAHTDAKETGGVSFVAIRLEQSLLDRTPFDFTEGGHPYFPAYLKPVNIRHDQVKKNKIRLINHHSAQGILAVPRPLSPHIPN